MGRTDGAIKRASTVASAHLFTGVDDSITQVNKAAKAMRLELDKVTRAMQERGFLGKDVDPLFLSRNFDRAAIRAKKKETVDFFAIKFREKNPSLSVKKAKTSGEKKSLNRFMKHMNWE